MQIHELDVYTGNLDGNSFVAVDNGTDTGKASIPSILKPATDAIDEANDRIDNIIAGGSAPSEAEIIDARLGANGVSYPSLGAAIRDQIETAGVDIDNLESAFIDGALSQYANNYIWGYYNLLDGTAHIDDHPNVSCIDREENPIELLSDNVSIVLGGGIKVRGVILNDDKTYRSYFARWVEESGEPSELQGLKGCYFKPILGKLDDTAFSESEMLALGPDSFSISAVLPIVEQVDANANAIEEITDVTSDNILDPATFIANGYYYNFTDGVTKVNNAVYKMTADKIHTGTIEKLYLRQTFSDTSTSALIIYCYDGETYLGYKSNSFASYGYNAEIEMQPGTTDIRVFSNDPTGNLTGQMICLSIKPLDEFEPYSLYHIIKKSALPSLSAHILSGKNIVFLGDSIYGNNQTATGVANVFEDLTGANVSNFAFGGTRATLHEGTSPYAQGWQKFDGISVAAAIANGNYSDMEAAISSGAMSQPAYFAETVSKMEVYDWSKCDYIIAGWGTNDWTGGASIADYQAALEQIARTILSAYPDIVLIVTTPFMRFFESGGAFYNSSVYDYRNDGVYLSDFVQAAEIMKNQPYNLQVVDCYNIGINDFTRSGFFSNNDWTHHDARGRQRIATYLSGRIC